jgi:hypothetical protein
MKRIKRVLLLLMVLILITGYPAVNVSAANTRSEVLYVGEDYTYDFYFMGKILKVTYSNKKVAETIKIERNSLHFKAKALGTTTITVKGEKYTYKINLTVKKMDVTATFIKKLQDGTYLVKFKNKMKNIFVESVCFAVVLRSQEDGFLEFSEINVSGLNPGATVYMVFKPDEDYEVDLTKSKLELDGFEIERGEGIKFTDCTAKMVVTDTMGGKLAPGESEITFKIKSKASDPASTYYTVMWYDAAGKMIAVEDKYYGDISPNEEREIWAFPPKQEYGPVSYKLAVRAYSKVYPTPDLDNFDIPIVKD